ncbi:MAG: hypothetical protein M3Y21_00625 [Candidatus Eremiobacteraeota bacterium]|nr:hypothetical protein [Candidatus Eremiobacteraeota bacterium]
MIARVWKGLVAAKDAGVYRDYLRDTGLAEYEASTGNMGAYALTSVHDEIAEIMTISLWESIDALKHFAGEEDYTVAKFYPEDERYLLAADPVATHYEVD